MNRRKFLVASLLTSPLVGIVEVGNAKETVKPFRTAAGEGRRHGHIQLKGVNKNILDNKN